MWSSAFGAANDVIGGVFDGQPFPRANSANSKEKKNVNSHRPQSTTLGKKRKQKDVLDSDTDEDECGAFNQPSKLAKFMQSIGSTDTSILPTVKSIDKRETLVAESDVTDGKPDEVITYTEPRQQRSLEQRCSTQICRNWLKHTFLNFGKPCNTNPCLRLHQLPEQPQRLYNDFSFKGLQSKQQKIIFNSYKKKHDEATGLAVVIGSYHQELPAQEPVVNSHMA